MTELYSSLSQIYEAMYQTFIDYEEEFAYYSGILKQYQCRSVVEIGCGTGNLAQRFKQADFDYLGMDISQDMLKIAAEKHPDSHFLQGDMRQFQLPDAMDSAIITARSLSYLVENSEVYDSFCSVFQNLKMGGLLVFDIIDANRFIPDIFQGKEIRHTAHFKGKEYFRDSFLSVDFKAKSWTFNWLSKFYVKETAGDILLGTDDSTVRAFTKDDISLLLEMAGFEILAITDRRAYMFDTLVFVAIKTEKTSEKLRSSSCSNR